MTEVLWYPQVVLLVAPVLLRLAWVAGRPMLLGVSPRARSAVLLVMIVLPVVAIAVPYVPALVPHLPVPWRSPIAWGMANFPDPADGLAYNFATLVTAALMLVPPAALFVLLVRSARQSRRLAGLCGAAHPAGFTLVPGRGVALTVGLWRPRVLLSADVWDGEHGEVILRHEQAHARGRHPLLVVLARAALVLWWWVPYSGRLLADLRDALEESADAAASRSCGRIRVARAIVDSVVGQQPTTALGFGGPDCVEQRLATLAHGFDQIRTRRVVLAGAVVVPLWLLLF